MKDYKTQGIIIRVRDYQEADRIITIFSRDHGKIQAIAKGCRKQKSQKRGIIQLFTHADFALYKGRNMDTVVQCEARDSFGDIRDNLDNMAYASYIAELLDGFVNTGEKQEALFYLTLVVFHLLSVEDPHLLTRAFELRLMNLLGYQPHLESCVLCGQPLHGTKVVFSGSQGGCICNACAGSGSRGIECSIGTLRMLEQLSTRDMRKLGVLKMTKEIKKEIDFIMKTYIEQRLDRKLKSAEFLEAVAKGG